MHYIGEDSLDKIWCSVVIASKIPDYQQIHFNYIQRAYLTPRKSSLMKQLLSPNCTLCPDGLTGTYMHFFWSEVCVTLSYVLDITVPCSPIVLILNEKVHIEKSKKTWFYTVNKLHNKTISAVFQAVPSFELTPQ